MGSPPDQAASNVEALERIWRRSPFHDRSIEAVTAINQRVLIRVENHTLIITGVTHLERCELPTVWLYNKLKYTGDRRSLEVRTETGVLQVSGENLRLIRNDDLSILIPSIDDGRLGRR